MATNFKLKRSSVANKRPGLSNLELGELALNTYDGFLFTERNGLGITTVTNLTPWYENYGAGSIFYTNKVGIGTTAVPDTNQLLVKGGTETDRLNVTGISTHVGIATFNGATFHDDVTFDTANGNDILFDKSDNALEFGDNVQATFGNNSDLQIFHNGTNNHFITKNGKIELRHSIGGVSEAMAKFTPNGSVQLRYDNSTKIETTISGIRVTGTTDTDNFINTGISTFVGIITASATENVIPFLYSAFSDLPSASAYHGAFAHVHARGKGYFAHAANWYELVNKELDGTIGVGTEQVRVGVTTVSDFNATGNVTLGDADTDNIVLNGEINSNVIPNTNIAYDLGSTTKRWGTLFTGATTKIDSDIVTRNLSVTGLGTFANDVTFTGASYNAVWDQSDSALEFADNAKVKFGDSGDLDIYHSGNGSFIRDTGTGPLTILTNQFLLRNAGNNEELIEAFENSSVNLFYDDTKRLATSGVGVTVYNQLDTTNINASGIITAVNGNFTGNVSIAGTLTYQDVTNVDSVGIATARVGLDVLSGGINAVGIVTADGLDAIGIQSGGVNITTGIITAINFTGTGNTVTYDSSTKIVSVSVGGAGGGTGGKFVANNTGIHTLSNVGIGTTNASDKLKVLGDVAFTGALKVSPLGLSGSSGNYLKSVGTGVTWAAFPTARTVGLQTATANQTSFSFAYNVGFLDVYINGVKLTTNEFTATNGTSVVLTEGAFVGDQVQFISFNTTATGSGGGGGISNVVEDSTPQLGGNLDLNSKIINGTGNIDYTGNFKASGIATATTFVGNLTGNVTGTATEATNVTVSANNTTNETVYPVFVDGATGTQGAETDTGLTYNPNTGNLTATKFSGDGSSITGISTSNITNYGVGLGGGGGSIAGISTTGTSNFANLQLIGIATGLNVSGVLTATTFNGSGASLTNIPAGQLTGTVADARITTLTSSKLSGALPAISGANLTNLPAANLTGTLPAISGANLTGIAVTEAPVTDYTITANGSSAYRFAGGGVNSSSDNPDLYLVRGQKYRFNNTTGSSHPFAFRDSANGADYTSGISGSQNGIQFFTVPLDAPALLKYRCTIHTGNMVGNIYIRGAGGQETNVGFTTFSNKIEVQSSSNTTATFKGSGGAGFINITDGDDGTLAFLGVDGGTFKIQTSGGSYSDKLTVAPDGTTTFKNTSGGTLKVGGSSAHTSKIVIADNAGTANGNCLVEGGDGTDFFTIQSNGNVQFPNGKGINFGATAGSGASSSIFDDYEEGSWTPNIRNTGTTANWNNQTGTYVKIGQQVTVWFNADGGTSPRSGGTSSSLIMTGLPFTQSMFGNPILGIVGANKSSGTGLYSTIGVIFSGFGQAGTQVRFGAGGQPINFGIDYVAGCLTYTAAS